MSLSDDKDPLASQVSARERRLHDINVTHAITRYTAPVYVQLRRL